MTAKRLPKLKMEKERATTVDHSAMAGERAVWETVMETGNGVDAKQIESLDMPACDPMLLQSVKVGTKKSVKLPAAFSYRDLLHDKFEGIWIWRNCTGSGN